MTPKEKAKELLELMECQTYSYQEYAGANESTTEIGYEAGKKCALICVNEIINSIRSKKLNEFLPEDVGVYMYWNEVKQEIEKL